MFTAKSRVCKLTSIFIKTAPSDCCRSAEAMTPVADDTENSKPGFKQGHFQYVSRDRVHVLDGRLHASILEWILKDPSALLYSCQSAVRVRCY